MIDLAKWALYFSKITDWSFDISFASIQKRWKFGGSMTEMCTLEAVKESLVLVGYEIIVDEQNSTILPKLKGMKIGFGTLREGWAVDG